MPSTRSHGGLLGLIGKKRSGKDTFAGALVDAGWTRVAFADPLKRAAYDLDPHLGGFGVTRLAEVVDFVGWERAKDDHAEARRTLQRLGVAIRNLDPDFWLRQALRTIDDVGGPVVVTDVRFPNEAEAIRDRGGLLVRIVRPDTEVYDPHPSETALDDWTDAVTIRNVLGIEDLRRVALAIGGPAT